MRDVYRDDDDLQATQVAIDWIEHEERKAARRAARAERREDRRQTRILIAQHVLAFVVIYTLAFGTFVSLVVAWAKTGDDRFGGIALGLAVAVYVGYLSCFERTTRGGGQR